MTVLRRRLCIWIALGALLFGAFSCKHRAGKASALKDDTESAPVYAGCYQVTGVTGEAPASARVSDIKEICIAEQLTRSGTHTFELKDANQQVIHTVGLSMAELQPRCEYCYAFESIDGRATWEADQINHEAIQLSTEFRIFGDREVKFSLARAGTNSSSSGAAYLGCFNVTGLSSQAPATARDADIKEICISEQASRSGTHTFELKDANKQVIYTVGMSMAEMQPRCELCWAFESIDGRAMWAADQVNHESIKFSTELRIFSDRKVIFSLARAGSAPSGSPDKEWAGCFGVIGVNPTTVPFRLERAKKICIEERSTRSGNIVFEFQTADGTVINMLGMDMAEAQPRCPHCYAFEGFDGSAMWDGEQESGPISLEMTLKHANNTAVTFKLARP